MSGVFARGWVHLSCSKEEYLFLIECLWKSDRECGLPQSRWRKQYPLSASACTQQSSAKMEKNKYCHEFLNTQRVLGIFEKSLFKYSRIRRTSSLKDRRQPMNITEEMHRYLHSTTKALKRLSFQQKGEGKPNKTEQQKEPARSYECKKKKEDL